MYFWILSFVPLRSFSYPVVNSFNHGSTIWVFWKVTFFIGVLRMVCRIGDEESAGKTGGARAKELASVARTARAEDLTFCGWRVWWDQGQWLSQRGWGCQGHGQKETVWAVRRWITAGELAEKVNILRIMESRFLTLWCWCGVGKVCELVVFNMCTETDMDTDYRQCVRVFTYF